jgi:serine protease Do
MLTGSVSAKQQKVDSSDARPIVIPSPVNLSNGFSAIVKQVGPAVVNINTESLPKAPVRRGGRRGAIPNPQAQPPDGDDNSGSGVPGDQGDMQDFFNRFFGGQGGQRAPEQGPMRALGSGFIVDPRGYIITNNHVVDGADKIYVKLSTDPQSDIPGDQGRPATVVGTDKETDIAVIKIDPAGLNLPVAKLGNSDGAAVGDWVLAIGSPFGLSQTVSAGIVSARNRSIDEAPSANGLATNQFQKFIQTDAAINPGNSGGPLVDMAGEVIGMNTAIYTQSSGSEGIGFAMPSNIIASVYNMLIGPDHKVTRGSIGITLPVATSSAAAREYGFANGGVFVNSVTPGLPADKAGIHAKDVIVSIDGVPIKDGDQLIAVISAKRPGSTIKLGYKRDGKFYTTECGIVDRSKLTDDMNKGDDDSNAPDAVDVGKDKLGITVKPLDPARAARLHVPGGVVVTSVKTGSFADENGLGNGAVITEINRRPVTDMASYNAIVSGLKSGQDVVFVITGTNGNSLVGGTLP